MQILFSELFCLVGGLALLITLVYIYTCCIYTHQKTKSNINTLSQKVLTPCSRRIEKQELVLVYSF